MEHQAWINDIFDNTIKNYNGRKIALWGYYSVSKKINEMIQDMNGGVTEVIYVDKDIKKIDNKIVFSPEILKNKSSEYYVVIPVAYYKSLKEQITDYGYIKDKDYYYFCDCIIEQREDYYEDSHGNKIIGNYSGLHFAFSGFNSEVIIGEKCKFSGAELYVHNNVKINIGDNVKFEESNIWVYDLSVLSIGSESVVKSNVINIKEKVIFEIGKENVIRNNLIGMYKASNVVFQNKLYLSELTLTMHQDAKLCIGENSYIANSRSNIVVHSYLKIGKRVTVGCDLFLMVPRETEIIIGDDCMFSWNVSLISNDGHSIFDVKTGENINSTSEINKKKKIIIGDHVWIGMGSKILYGTEIGNGSIIGAGSLVKSKIPNNCIASGIPAKVIRRDIAWSRNNGSDNILDCGEEYINFTEE